MEENELLCPLSSSYWNEIIDSFAQVLLLLICFVYILLVHVSFESMHRRDF